MYLNVLDNVTYYLKYVHIRQKFENTENFESLCISNKI